MVDNPNNQTPLEESDLDPIYLMEEVFDKLKILDFETLFMKQK
jgi:hypothetical protein